MYLQLYRTILITFFFFQAEDGIRDDLVTGVQTCALPICHTGAAEEAAGRRGAGRRAVGQAAGPKGCAGAQTGHDPGRHPGARGNAAGAGAMNRGKPVSPPASPPASPCASPTPTLTTAEDWLARIAALDAPQPPPTPPRLRNPRKANRRRAGTIVAVAGLLVLLAMAVAVAVQLMWVK